MPSACSEVVGCRDDRQVVYIRVAGKIRPIEMGKLSADRTVSFKGPFLATVTSFILLPDFHGPIHPFVDTQLHTIIARAAVEIPQKSAYELFAQYQPRDQTSVGC